MTYIMRKTLQAAALRYDEGVDEAPRVVAAGEGHLARIIIERAKQHGVPVLEDAGLTAELLHVGLDEQVPSRVYYAVAKVLAFVYALEQKQIRSPKEDPERGRGEASNS